jgi:hypothetical protein
MTFSRGEKFPQAEKKAAAALDCTLFNELRFGRANY